MLDFYQNILEIVYYYVKPASLVNGIRLTSYLIGQLLLYFLHF